MALMKDTREPLVQLLDTLDVMADKKLLRNIEISRRQARKGKTRSFRKLLAELKLEPQIQDRPNSKVRK